MEAAKQSRSNFLKYLQFIAPQILPEKFVYGRHHELIAEHLQLVEQGKIKRLMICLCPGSTKSVMTSVAFGSWVRGLHPRWPIISASHTIDLAQKFARDVRDLMTTEEFQSVFPNVTLREDVKAAGLWYTNQGGIYLAAGATKKIAGMRARLAILDDVISEQDVESDATLEKIRRWYTGGLLSRLLPDGRIVLINTRWSLKDLSQLILDEEKKNPLADQWVKIEIPAILDETSAAMLGSTPGESYWPEYWSKDRLMQIKANILPYQWESLYMQRPISEQGNLFKVNHFKWWGHKKNDVVTPPACEYIIQTVDLAATVKNYSDYSVIQTWGLFPRIETMSDGKEFTAYHMILLDQWRDKAEYPEIRRKTVELYQKYKPNKVLIEAKLNGFTLIQDLRRVGFPIGEYPPRGDKRTRAMVAIPFMESGRLWLPEGKQFAQDLYNEALAFNPMEKSGKGTHAHDDQVDALMMAVDFCLKHFKVHSSGDRWENEPREKTRTRTYWS